MNRLKLYCKRLINAASLGLYFPGTSHFNLPDYVRSRQANIKLTSPPESSIAYDFINIWLDDEYGLKSFSHSPQTILDVGANIGLFSLWAHQCFPSAKIHAYEPNPQVTEYTQKNLDQADKIALFKEGIASVSGFASMKDCSESRLSQLELGGTDGIPITSLAHAIDRLGGSVDLLKLDCEGGEWDIFKDYKSFKQVKYIHMEYHLTDEKTLEDFKKIVKEIGFQIDWIQENSGFGIAWLSKL